VKSADKTLEIFPEGYHELLNDLDRDAALALILGWLEARRPR
jgi:alpha-beta hydrolase superfamily lysophospholipase